MKSKSAAKPIGNVLVPITDMPGKVPGVISIKQIRAMRKRGLKCIKHNRRLHAWTKDVTDLLSEPSRTRP